MIDLKETNVKKTKRIAKNTLVLYFRMLFLMLVSLYTSRVVLDALGVEDYGIYNVVGGFVAMFGLISAALTSASSRFLNYEMGKGNKDRQQVVFSTAVTIQWVLAIIVAILAEVIGVWYINNMMVLPINRLVAANWCFQFSVFNFCMNIITVPYNASIIAHEKMTLFAYVSIFQGLGILSISYLIYISPFDKLVFYAFMLLLLQFSVRIMYQIYCKQHFAECSYKKVVDRSLLKQMLSYSVWHFVGNGASVLKNHGVNIVLNYFTGPTVNAARGIANQVESAVAQFSSNFMMAMNPQITQSFAKGDMKYVFSLIEKGSRYSFYLLLLLSLPIILNADYILNLWLKHVPDYTIVFVQLSLIVAMINCISRPLITVQNATGNVRNYQLVVGGINLLNLPLCYVALKSGFSPFSIVIVAIIVEILAMFARVFWLPNTVPGFNPLSFLKRVSLHCLLLTCFSICLPVTVKYIDNSHSFVSFTINIIISVISTLFVIWFFGCGKNERKIVKNKVKGMYKRIK